MRYLLDSHVAIVLANGTGAVLPPSMRSLLADTSHSFLVSVAGLWEIAIKARLGKLRLRGSLEELPAHLAILGIEFLDVRLWHSLTLVDPEPPTKDPFDKMLLAVAQVEGCQLVTLDRSLRGHPLAWKPAPPLDPARRPDQSSGDGRPRK